MQVDVAIVGAGPAGCAAAISAARLGLHTAIVDRAEFPRDKTCGDGLTTSALRLLEDLGITAAMLRADDCLEGAGLGYRSVRDVVLRSPSGRRVDLPLPPRGEFAAVVSRRTLDAVMLAEVPRPRVETRTGFEVTAIEPGPDRVTIRSGDQSIEARWVIACDGHWSTVRKLLRPGDPPYLGEWHAVRQYHADVNVDRMWVLFERDLLPGYAWVFPLPNGHANVGYGVLRAQGRSGKQLKALWPDLLERPSMREVLGPSARAIEPVRAWPIPTRYRPGDLVTGRVLFAGDAAAVVDPMTGEGIAQAIETGMLAAQAIGAGHDVGATYRASVHEAIGRDLRFARTLSRLLAAPWSARAALRAVDTNAWTRAQFARWMFEDYPRAALFTPRRWPLMRPHAGAASA
jgi:geranylgeranyl reductase family protein